MIPRFSFLLHDVPGHQTANPFTMCCSVCVLRSSHEATKKRNPTDTRSCPLVADGTASISLTVLLSTREGQSAIIVVADPLEVRILHTTHVGSPHPIRETRDLPAAGL